MRRPNLKTKLLLKYFLSVWSAITNLIGSSKGLATDSKKPGGKDQFAPYFGWTLTELNNAPDDPLSDHSPITVDLPLTEPHPR
jgi:hypothetical protein